MSRSVSRSVLARVTLATVCLAACLASVGRAQSLVDASAWTATGSVHALSRVGDLLYVAGGFGWLGPIGGSGVARDHLAAIDLTTGVATSWAPDASDPPYVMTWVSAIAVNEDLVFAAVTSWDDFLQSNLSELRAYSRTTGAVVWSAVADGEIRALLCEGARLFVGGSFHHLQGNSAHLAALDPATGAGLTWYGVTDAPVHALAATPTALFVGGEFTWMINSQIPRLAQVSKVDGTLMLWQPTADATVRALAFHGSTLLVGGDFASVGSQSRARVAALQPATETVLPWNPGANGSVTALATDGVLVYAGGSFTSLAGQPAGRLAAVRLSDASRMGWEAKADEAVLALADSDDRVYAGGHFWNIDDTPTRGLAALHHLASTGVEPAQGATFAMWPSPIQDVGRIRFTLPSSAAVRLSVFDVAGREVANLIDGIVLGAGPHEREFRRGSLVPGIYAIRLALGSSVSTRRVVLLR